jgi:outer membrane protein OmpA-like peptidoglycan-associated protein
MVKQYNSQTNVIFIVIILFIFYFIIKNFNTSTNKPKKFESYKEIEIFTKNEAIMVFFDFNKHKFDEKNKNMLDKYFSTHGKQYNEIRIVGHTDPIGSKEVNTLFGYLRATAVLHYLNKIGVSTKKFTIISKDYTDPLHNSVQDYNRRVEIFLR